MSEYSLNIPGQDPEIVGETELVSIVRAAIDVSSVRGGRSHAEENALILAAALSSAKDARVDDTQAQQAYAIGTRIGQELRSNSGRKKKDWVTYSPQ